MTAPSTEGTILVIGDVAELSGSLISALSNENYRVRSIEIAASTGPITPRRYGIDPTSERGVASLVEYLRTQDGDRSVSAIVSLLGVGSGPSRDNVTEQLFLLLQKLHLEYSKAAEGSTALLLNVIELDGRMGMTGKLNIDEDRIGTVGLCKSIGREHRQIHCVNLDLAPELSIATKLAAIFESIVTPPELSEVGLDSEGRWTVSLRHAEPNSHELSLQPACGPESVILVTGGGDGVTAYVLKQFAAASPTMIIVGRTPLPEAHDEPYLDFDEKALRAKLIQETDKKKLNLSELEKRVGRYQKQSRIRRNLAMLRELGAKVEYILADVANTHEFENVIDDIYRRYGRIDGVLHGAGVIRDKLLADKTLEAFRLVYSTKVDSARTLAKKLRPEGLKFLVFFSSIASRFGNNGQTDYSAANEYLNKLSNHLDKTWPGRVVAIQWGPWDGGMVQEFLKVAFERHGIRMIPMDDGATRLAEELQMKGRSGGEILISRSVEKLSSL